MKNISIFPTVAKPVTGTPGTVITNYALALIAAGAIFDPIWWKVGDTSALDGLIIDPDDKDVHSLVYVGDASQIVRSIIDNDTIQFVINIPITSYGFNVGNVGIFDSSGGLICMCVLEKPFTKIHSRSLSISFCVKVTVA